MDHGTRRAGVVGALVGLLCVGALVAAVVLGDSTAKGERDVSTDGPVLVALVLPDADGGLAVRALERLSRAGSTLTVASVDPLTSATVPGTSATTLAEAHAYGGGAGLAAAYAGGRAGDEQAWIVVSPEAWQRLMGPASIGLDLASDIEVFDGRRLYSYPAGDTTVSAGQAAQLMNGVAYSPAEERRTVREALGAALASALARGYLSEGARIDSNLTTEQLDALLSGVKPTPVRADTSP